MTEPTTDELRAMKPCPFCGSANIDPSFAKGYEAGDMTQPVVGAGCESCGSAGPTIRVPDHSSGEAEAAAAWNTRQLETALRAKLAEAVAFWDARKDNPDYRARNPESNWRAAQLDMRIETLQSVLDLLDGKAEDLV